MQACPFNTWDTSLVINFKFAQTYVAIFLHSFHIIFNISNLECLKFLQLVSVQYLWLQNRAKPYALTADCQNNVNHWKCMYGCAAKVFLSTFNVLPPKQITSLVHDMSTCILLPLRTFEFYSEESLWSLE